MIILAADDYAQRSALIREILEGLGQVVEKFQFKQLFRYRTTLTDLDTQYPL